jgi:DNA polymerase III subunit alpha
MALSPASAFLLPHALPLTPGHPPVAGRGWGSSKGSGNSAGGAENTGRPGRTDRTDHIGSADSSFLGPPRRPRFRRGAGDPSAVIVVHTGGGGRKSRCRGARPSFPHSVGTSAVASCAASGGAAAAQEDVGREEPASGPVVASSAAGPAKQYVPLHVHSDFSLLDGASHLSDLVARASELGVPALALTDHGVLYGAIQLVRHCRAANPPVKPIIGNEMYVVNVNTTPYVAPEATEEEVAAAEKSGKKAKKPKPPRRYHLIVLAKNTTGYRNLVKLTTHAHLDGKVGTGIFARPCVNKAMLYEHREGLIVSSGCLGGEVAQAILDDRPDVARDVARWFRDAFGDDYYLEIQDHGSEQDRKVNRQVIAIGNELSIPVICTNDSHFTSCLDAEAHDALICIQTGKVLDDVNRMRYAGNEYFKSVDEMRACFIDHLHPSDVDKALAYTLRVADKVEEYDLFGDTRIPDFPIPPCPTTTSGIGYDDANTGSYLRYVAREGMSERLRARLASGLLQTSVSDEEVAAVYSERLEFELDMIHQMGFASYFLVVWDYIRHARSELIPVGPGRGSAAGSLVAFALRITDVDPIQYNLLFERFLNPERKSMPDIDTDFSVEGRERIIRYVTNKYGCDRVAQIITFNRLTSKAVLKDVARVHQVPYSEADKLAKLIPVARGKPATLSAMLGDKSPSKEFKQILKARPEYGRWMEKARRIEGTNKSVGIHAAGVVISAEPLTDSLPLSRAKHGETITQYPMEDVEALGLLKMDFLGLKNLSVIESTLSFINAKRRRVRERVMRRSGVSDVDNSVAGSCSDLDFSVDALPLDDPKTYHLLATGELDGIFQLDASGGMRSIVRELRPSSLDDISAILALYRPGPLDAGLIPKFIRRKHGNEPIVYDHPLLEPILRETYGIMVYQEQIMRIARDLAGYSLGQADILRRAMGKKKVSDMEREQPRFVAGAVMRGVSEKVATELFGQMIMFAEYCFNKSHSTAYAYLTYQTAYLKANHPVEYLAALLKANSNQSDKLVRYLADANASGVRVLSPCINRSELGFSVAQRSVGGGDVDGEEEGTSVVLFGLEAVKTVGDSVGNAIIEEREARGRFKSIVDLIERVDSRVLNKRSMGALVMCGAFDELHPNRKVLAEQLEVLLNLHRKVRDRRKRRAKKVMTPEQEQKAIEQDVADWEGVQLDLHVESKACPDFPMLEKLAAEKATLGFYASGHPLYDLDRVRSLLGCTPVANIVGEGVPSQGELGHSDGVGGISLVGGTSEYHEYSDDGDSLFVGTPAANEPVADGADVLCLSLVTDLKRMITSRGQKMAKWTMEDACGRVSAVVFPSTYTICEAHVEHASVEAGASESGVVDEEFVVKNDARVVVWGKVDRESSGTTQVIVDDVQRVEDVQVLVATAAYDPERDFSSSSKVSLVRYIARQLEDPDSVYTVAGSDEYVYRNKNGEEVKGRRRSKKTNLETKPRIPIVVKQLGPGGSVLTCSYVGHSARLLKVTDRHLQLLSEKTGCVLELISICEMVPGFVGTEPVPVDVEAVSTTEIEQVDDDVCSEAGAGGDGEVKTEVLPGDVDGEIPGAPDTIVAAVELKARTVVDATDSEHDESEERKGRLRKQATGEASCDEHIKVFHGLESTTDHVINERGQGDRVHDGNDFAEVRNELNASGRAVLAGRIAPERLRSRDLLLSSSARAPASSRLVHKLAARVAARKHEQMNGNVGLATRIAAAENGHETVNMTQATGTTLSRDASRRSTSDVAGRGDVTLASFASSRSGPVRELVTSTVSSPPGSSAVKGLVGEGIVTQGPFATSSPRASQCRSSTAVSGSNTTSGDVSSDSVLKDMGDSSTGNIAMVCEAKPVNMIGIVANGVERCSQLLGDDGNGDVGADDNGKVRVPYEHLRGLVRRQEEIRHELCESFSPNQAGLYDELTFYTRELTAASRHDAQVARTGMNVAGRVATQGSSIEKGEVSDIVTEHEDGCDQDIKTPDVESVCQANDQCIAGQLAAGSGIEVDKAEHMDAAQEQETYEAVGGPSIGLIPLSEAQGVPSAAPVRMSTASPSFSLTDIDVTQTGFGNLIDTVCLVAGEAAWSYSRNEFSIKAVDEIALKHPAEGLVDISGIVACVEGAAMHVLVRVRESTPAGGRKRIRVLGSAVVTFTSAWGSLTPGLEPKSIRARNDESIVKARLVEAASRGVEAPQKSSFPNTDCFSVVSDMTLHGDTLFDGGNLLLWMSQAAEGAVRQGASEAVRPRVSPGADTLATASVSDFYVASDFCERLSQIGTYVRVTAQVLRVALDVALVEVVVADDRNYAPLDGMSGRICAGAMFSVKTSWSSVM